MAADSFRNRTASHRRKTIDAAAGTQTIQTLGDVRISADPTAFEGQAADLIDAEAMATEVMTDPKDDIRPGDFLSLADGTELEVVRAPKYPFAKGAAQVLVRRREVPA